MRAQALPLLLLAAVGAWGQRAPAHSAADPLGDPVIANQEVRIFRFAIPPKEDAVLPRRGHSYVIVALGEGRTTDVVAGVDPWVKTWKMGDWDFDEGKSRRVVRNLSGTVFSALVVEILRADTGMDCQTKRGKRSLTVICGTAHLSSADSFPLDGTGHDWSNSQRHGDLILAHNGIHPGGKMSWTNGAGVLLVPITELAVSTPSEETKVGPVRHQPGDFVWINGGVSYTLGSAGKDCAEFMTLGFREKSSAEVKR